MQSPIYVTAPGVRLPDAPPAAAPGGESADLLRQLIELNREQVTLLRAVAAAHDPAARWRAFLGRWQDEFPEVGQACRQVLPQVERAYLRLVQELADRLRDEDADDLDNEFVLTEFLDRYGMRFGQLGTIVGQLSPIADAAPPPPAKPEDSNPG